MPRLISAFDLPDRLSAKADPALIGEDERRFAAIAESLERSIVETAARLEEELAAPADGGEYTLGRDTEVHRLTARLRSLRRFGRDVVLGRMVVEGEPHPVYIGRFALADADGERLLLDWRVPAAAPFFAATHADPMGLVSRRRYRWTLGRVSDYWDEVFTADGLEQTTALDDQSAFIATLGGSRSSRMRDVLATIQADQDAIIRAGSRGALVVDGGPGTGKTVVALHRTAYLLYADPRLGHHRGGVLFVGPHEEYLRYVGDVLPSLGEEGVQTCTLRDLVPEGRDAGIEADARVASLKSTVDAVELVENAVRHFERPPTETIVVETPWAEVEVGPAQWAEAFSAAETGVPHDDARDGVWDELVAIVADAHGGDSPSVRRAIQQDDALRTAFAAAWPLLDPVRLVEDLWAVPAFLRACGPQLDAEARELLRREPGSPWTASDLPLLDAARLRVGDPDAVRGRRRRAAAEAFERERMSHVIDDLLEADRLGDGMLAMLSGQDLRNSLVDEAALPAADVDRLAGPFAHIVVDEAQELTDAEWRMLLARCPSRSMTIVGDRAQARHGFAESWGERLRRVGFSSVEQASLTVNYRTPTEVMAEAEPVIRAALPDANVPTSVRSTGIPVRRGSTAELDDVLREWLTTHDEGTACVIGDPARPSSERVRSLSPVTAKGLEFDLVVLVDPERFGDGIEGAVDRYVAMTRSTERLAILHAR